MHQQNTSVVQILDVYSMDKSLLHQDYYINFIDFELYDYVTEFLSFNAKRMKGKF